MRDQTKTAPMRIDAPMMAQTFQATFTAKVKSAVPPVMPAAKERFIQFGIRFDWKRIELILMRIAGFGWSRFVIADRAVPRTVEGMGSGGIGLQVDCGRPFSFFCYRRCFGCVVRLRSQV